MKYLLFFEEKAKQLRLFDDDRIDILFENDKWVIIEPKTYNALCEYGKDQGWSVANGNNEHYFRDGDTYINVNKEDGNRYLFDLYDNEFYGKDEKYLELETFLFKNEELLRFYGEKIECSEVIKDGDTYWMVLNDQSDFANFFDTDRRDISEKFIKQVLEGDIFDLFYYDNDIFDIDDYGLELSGTSFFTLKIMLILEKINDENDDLDYELNDIKDYSDACDVIEEYELDNIEKFLKHVITRSHEYADGDAAYDDILNTAYNFFGLDDKSAEWRYNKTHTHQDLYMKFKSKEDAYMAKLKINGIIEDNKIEYSSPYHGYSGDSKVVNEYFNNEFIERYYDYSYDNFTGEEIDECEKNWKELKEEYPNLSDDELFDKYKIFIDARKYNL